MATAGYSEAIALLCENFYRAARYFRRSLFPGPPSALPPPNGGAGGSRACGWRGRRGGDIQRSALQLAVAVRVRQPALAALTSWHHGCW